MAGTVATVVTQVVYISAFAGMCWPLLLLDMADAYRY